MKGTHLKRHVSLNRYGYTHSGKIHAVLRVRRLNNTPHYFVDEIGFRVGASVDQALK